MNMDDVIHEPRNLFRWDFIVNNKLNYDALTKLFSIWQASGFKSNELPSAVDYILVFS